MNEPLEPVPDELLDELLAPLRAVMIPDETRITNRAAIRRALERRVLPPWWRRTMAIPIPVAIAATVAFAIATTASLWPMVAQRRAEQVVSKPIQDRSIEPFSTAEFGDDGTSRSTWTISRSYIQSLGQGGDQDSLNREVKGKRNES